MTVVRRFFVGAALIGALPASLAPAASATPGAASFAICSPPAAGQKLVRS
jgi:hypothetical protein